MLQIFAPIVNYTAINATRTVSFNNSGFVSTSFNGTKVQLYSANATTAMAILQVTSPFTFSNLRGIVVVNISNELSILVADMNNITILNSTLNVVYSFDSVMTNFSQPTGLATANGVIYVTEATKITLFQIALVLINNTNTTSHSSYKSHSSHTSESSDSSDKSQSSDSSDSSHKSYSSHKSQSSHVSNHTNSTSHHTTSNSTKHIDSSNTSYLSSSYHSKTNSKSGSPQTGPPTRLIAIVVGSVGGAIAITAVATLIVCSRKKKRYIKYWY